MLCGLLTALSVTTIAATKEKAALPNIVFVLVDDLGWADVGYHKSAPADEIVTPTIDMLVKEGVELDRHYVHMMCTPTRAAFQSGRLPVHVSTALTRPCDENGAIPKNMTAIASMLKKAGYATHQVGKWDCGMVTPTHTPQGRGYDTSLGYFDHGNWMWSHRMWDGSTSHVSDVPEPKIRDLWDTDHPAVELEGTGYEEEIFRDRMFKILQEHDQSKPLFLNYDSRIAHYPLQVPPEYEAKFAHITFAHRRIYNAMINYLDDQLKNITGTMKDLGMWDNTLLVLSSDNGAFVKAPLGECNTTDASWPGASEDTDYGHGTACFNGESGGNNYPLRGGKYSNFEGGFRVTAFMSGGVLPAAVRGTKSEEMIHIADWYRTFGEGLAGLDVTDHSAAESGLPPVDSFNMWPLLSGQSSANPRAELGVLVHKDMLVKGQWKYVTGNTKMIESQWGSPQYPNETSEPLDKFSINCPSQGCLYDVVADPHEYNEVSADHPDIVAEMKAELQAQVATIWSTSHKVDPACWTAADEIWGGYFGPWKELESYSTLRV